jgi:hypothetical protein
MTMQMFSMDNQSNEQKLYNSQNIVNYVKISFIIFYNFELN